MTHLTLPSEVEPESLADLVADCRSMPVAGAATPMAGRAVPAIRSARAAGEPRPDAEPAVAIPDGAAALLEGMPDYGD